MARRISEATVEADRPKRRIRRYDWDKWSDGKWWEATKGEDFQVKPAVFARTVNNFARLNGKQSETTIVDDKVRFRIRKKEGCESRPTPKRRKAK